MCRLCTFVNRLHVCRSDSEIHGIYNITHIIHMRIYNIHKKNYPMYLVSIVYHMYIYHIYIYALVFLNENIIKMLF